jgi:hypothetical protein
MRYLVSLQAVQDRFGLAIMMQRGFEVFSPVPRNSQLLRLTRLQSVVLVGHRMKASKKLDRFCGEAVKLPSSHNRQASAAARRPDLPAALPYPFRLDQTKPRGRSP